MRSRLEEACIRLEESGIVEEELIPHQKAVDLMTTPLERKDSVYEADVYEGRWINRAIAAVTDKNGLPRLIYQEIPFSKKGKR